MKKSDLNDNKKYVLMPSCREITIDDLWDRYKQIKHCQEPVFINIDTRKVGVWFEYKSKSIDIPPHESRYTESERYKKFEL